MCQCWINVIPTYVTLGICWPSIGSTCRVCWVDTLQTQTFTGKPPWPRGDVLVLSPPGHEFRILRFESSVIWLTSLSSGGSPGQYSLHVHKSGQKTHSFHFITNVYYVWGFTNHSTWNIRRCSNIVLMLGDGRKLWQALQQHWFNVSWLLTDSQLR